MARSGRRLDRRRRGIAGRRRFRLGRRRRTGAIGGGRRGGHGSCILLDGHVEILRHALLNYRKRGRSYRRVVRRVRPAVGAEMEEASQIPQKRLAVGVGIAITWCLAFALSGGGRR